MQTNQPKRTGLTGLHETTKVLRLAALTGLPQLMFVEPFPDLMKVLPSSKRRMAVFLASKCLK